MTKNGFKVMDSDMHIMEPPDLWQKYIDPKFQSQAPHGLSETVDDLRMVDSEGQPWGRHLQFMRENKSNKKGRSFKENQERFKPFKDRGWTGGVQLEAMDEEGIDVAVIYPSRGLYALSVPNMDVKLAQAVARAYNDWLFDFCQTDPTRLIGAGMISPFDVQDAIDETRYFVDKLGFKGIFVRPNEVNDRNWHDLYYEPLWSALEELEIPIGFHEGEGPALRQTGEQFGGNSMLRHIFCHPVEQMMVAASFCGGGILDRHPKLKVAFLEGNCSWLPFLLWRMDEHWERLGDVHAPNLKSAPSEYFKKQCFASAEADEEPLKYVIDYMGNECLVFSTDFPHGDSKFPVSVNRFLELPIGHDDKRNILWENCARYYGMG